ncbi:MAG: DUF1697 domain-containing protein [Flavobacteriaceae bacterium]
MKYIALLRGINVSGKNKILMKDLRALLVKTKLSAVNTYIQSGNVCFESNETDTIKLALDIKNSIKEEFNLDVPVLVKTFENINYIINKNPFITDTIDVKKLYVAFLWKKPRDTSKLDTFDFGKDSYIICDDVIYLKYDIGAGRSKLSVRIIEKKLDLIASARNWRTTNKLLTL